MNLRQKLSRTIPVVVVLAVVAVAARAARSPVSTSSSTVAGPVSEDLTRAIVELNAEFERNWRREQITTAPPAADLQVLRRLSLALVGAHPSLEEIRAFEHDAQPDRLLQWARRLLADKRFEDYFAQRLSRAFIGAEGGQFVIFRRDRFNQWLREELHKNTPYDQIVRTMISERGLWTDRPATNFVTAAVNEGDVDENKLTGKNVRAFLGQRIDCAQCHDHPFEHWKQREFEGLAAFYGQVQPGVFGGIEDKSKKFDGTPIEYEVEDRKTLVKHTVAEGVPFHSEWLPPKGTRRTRLAAWITHPENRRFERAIVNRVWGLLFGQPWHAPVDDLPDPPSPENRDVLDLLGHDFREHGCDLKRLILIIAASRPFRLDSASAAAGGALDGPPHDDAARAQWAVFPLVRLRPEQVIGSIVQSTSVQTADQNSHVLFRTVRLLQEGQFVKEYGDPGENELEERGETIPQRLLLMNGKLACDAAESGPFSALARIAAIAPTDEACVETTFLVCLTRRPSAVELAHFAPQLAGKSGPERRQVAEDLFWTLFNSTEFSWNH